MRARHYFGSALAAFALAACSGGSITGVGTPANDGTATPANLTVVLASSATRLDPSATSTAQGVTLTATVTNSDGSAASNVLVNFNQDSFGSGTASINPGSGRTDANGRFSAAVTTGGDSVPRTVVIAAEVERFSGSSNQSLPVSIQVRAVENAATVRVSADRNVLSPSANSPSQGITLTATAVGASGQVLAGVPVSFTASNAALQVTQAVTDSSGRAFAVVTSGGDPSSRSATATATADGVSSVPFPIEVRDATSLVLAASSNQLSPSAQTLDQGVVLTATLRDANGNPLASAPVNFSSDGGQIQVTRGTTDAAGTATAVLTTGGDAARNLILVTASTSIGGSSLQASRTINVVEPTASIILIADSPELASNASQTTAGVRLTALVRNASNNLVQNALVEFSSTTGALQVVRALTDATGTAEAVLSTGGDPTLRAITVNATSGNFSDDVVINVVGNQITINAPSAVSLNSTELVTVTVRNSGNVGVSNQPVTLTSSLMGLINGQVGSATASTNSQGQVTFTYTPGTAGTDVLTATSAGVSNQVSVNVGGVALSVAFNPATPTDFTFNTPANVVATLLDDGEPVPNAQLDLTATRGMLSITSGMTGPNGQLAFTITSDGTGGAGLFLITATAPNNGGISASLGGEFVAINPTQVSLQAEPAKIGLSSSSTIRAVVRDVSNNLVKNQRVNFVLSDASGGSLSAATGVTNSQGEVSVTYRSSTTSSAENGVLITANVVDALGATLATAQTMLTVGGTALRITLGTGNELLEPDTTTYALPYTVIVTDAAGNPAPASTVFRLKIRSLEYQKGGYDTTQEPPALVYTVDPLTDPFAGASAFGCRNEDLDGSGTLVPANDDNGNGLLDPGNVASVPETVALDANGIGNFQIRYPQDRGNWVLVELTATASVSGTESREVRSFVLRLTATDAESASPPGNPSPYGFANLCSNPQ